MSSETSSRSVRRVLQQTPTLCVSARFTVRTPASWSGLTLCMCSNVPVGLHSCVFVCAYETVSLLLHVWYRLQLETTRSRMFIWAPTLRNWWFDWLTTVTGYINNTQCWVINRWPVSSSTGATGIKCIAGELVTHSHPHKNYPQPTRNSNHWPLKHKPVCLKVTFSFLNPSLVPWFVCDLCVSAACVLSRSVLTSLKVDPVALQSSEKTGRVKGLIITMKGNQSKKN